MKYYFSIKLKLIIYILSITLGAVLVLGVVNYKVTEKELKSELKEKFTLISTLKVNKVLNYFEQVESSISLIQNNKYIRSNLPYYTGLITTDPSFASRKQRTSEVIIRQLNYIKETKGINNIALISNSGEQLFTTGHIDYSNEVVKEFSTDFNLGSNKTTYSDNYYVLGKYQNYEPRMLAKTSFSLLGEQPVIIICELDLSQMMQGIKDTTSLKSTGESIIFRKKGDKVIYINTLRHDKNHILRDTLTAQHTSKAEVKALKRLTGFGFDHDYRNQEVLVYWSFIPKMNWGIITKMDTDEAYESINYLKGISIIIGLFILIITTLVITIFADNFIKPIIDIKNNLIDLYNGAFPKTLTYKKNDELKQTTDAINALVDRLKVSTEFASKIGKGDLNAQLDTQEYGDVLNKSLMHMRDNIVLSNDNEEKRNWTMLGQAYLGEALRSNNDDIEKWSNTLLSEICRYTDATVGAFYIKKRNKIVPIATFAYDIKKLTSLDPGQSLAGQAFNEQKPLNLLNEAAHYLRISSTLGSMSPKHLLIIPLVHENTSLGVIELGFVNEIEEYKVTFLNDFSKSIASMIPARK